MNEKAIEVADSDTVYLESEDGGGVEDERLFSESSRSIKKSGNESNKRTITVHLPLTAQNIQVIAFMKNSPWPHNCDLSEPKNGGLGWNKASTTGGEPMPWAKVRNAQINTSATNIIVTADFHNWSHCNLRWGKLKVAYTLPD